MTKTSDTHPLRIDIELREVIERMAVDLFLGFQDGEDWWGKYPGF